ncbi:MAG: YihY/virulence factor BrkB family protein [Acidimicrobiales bacterium]
MRAALVRVRRHRRVAEAVDIGRQLAREWRDDRLSGLAAEVAFFGVLSVFPALLATAALLGSLESIAGQAVSDRVEQGVLDVLDRFLTPEAAGVTEAVRGLFAESRTGVLTAGVVLAVMATSRGFAAVIRALDVAYDLPPRPPWLRTRLKAIVLSIGSVVVAVVMLAMLVLGPLLGRGRGVAEAIGLGDAFATFWEVFRAPVAVAVLVGWAATVFHVAPNHRTPWRWDLPGAVVTGLLWLSASLGFRLYLVVAGEANQVFGLFGGALIVLFWLYLLGVGLLVGGELNAVLAKRRDQADRSGRAD